MSNTVTLTQRVDTIELAAELATAGVTVDYNVDDTHIRCRGAVWDAMDASTKTDELATIATAEAAHAPTTITKVNRTTAPHEGKLLEECLAVAGVTQLSVEWPPAYAGNIYLRHNSLTSGEQANLVTAVTDHDPTDVPSLALDVSDLQVSGDGVATGTITVTDSRGAAAEDVVLDVIPPLQPIALDKTSITLNSSGVGTLVFGPSPASGYVSGKLPVGFRYNGSGVIGDGADATVQYT